MDVRTALIDAAVVLTLSAVGWMAYQQYTTPRATGDGKSIETKAAPAVKNVKKKDLVMKNPLKVYDDKAKPALNLPDEVKADPKKHVASSTQIQADPHPQSVTTIVDEKTGEFTTFTKLDPYPWLAFEPRGSIGMAYGAKYQSFDHGTHVVGRLRAEYELVRVKALKIGIEGTLDTDRDAFIGIGVKYQF